MKFALRVAAASLFVCGFAPGVIAQAPKKAPAAAPRKPPTPPKRPQASPTKELDRFSKMSPEERDQALAKLPPARRNFIEKNLTRYQNMTPEQQERFKQRLELMRSLPQERQAAVRQQIEQLRAMPPAERRKALYSEEFKQNYSPDEQELIRDGFPNMRPKQDY